MLPFKSANRQNKGFNETKKQIDEKERKMYMYYKLARLTFEPRICMHRCRCRIINTHSRWILLRVKSKQSPGTKTIRAQIQPSKPKREITNIANSQNTKITYGQPSEQLFPKRLPLSNRNRTKYNMSTLKVKRHRNSDTKTGNREPQQNYRL